MADNLADHIDGIHAEAVEVEKNTHRYTTPKQVVEAVGKLMAKVRPAQHAADAQRAQGAPAAAGAAKPAEKPPATPPAAKA
jgi:hypothetical protein